MGCGRLGGPVRSARQELPGLYADRAEAPTRPFPDGTIEASSRRLRRPNGHHGACSVPERNGWRRGLVERMTAMRRRTHQRDTEPLLYCSLL